MLLNLNPFFTTDASDYTGFGGTFVRSTAQFHEGNASGLLTPDGVSATARAEMVARAISPGADIQLSFWARCATARTVAPSFNWFNAAGTYITTTTGPGVALAANTWTLITYPLQVPGTPTGIAKVSGNITLPGTPLATDLLNVDEVKLDAVAAAGEPYANYADLAANKTEGVHFQRKTTAVAGATYASIAVHGGGIEAGSGEMAREVAAGLMNHYEFSGIQAANNFAELHLTSTHFDEPTAVAMVAASRHTFSFHGYAGVTDLAETSIGGLDAALVTRVTAALRAAGFRVITAASEIAGTNPLNICNKTATGGGVQLEMSRALRDSFFPGNDSSRTVRDSGARTDTFYAYAAAVRSAMGATGRVNVGSVNSSRWTTVPVSVADVVVSSSVTTSVAPAGGSHFAYVAARWLDVDNCYLARVEFPVSGFILLTVRKRVAATETALGSTFTSALTYTPGTPYSVELDVSGTTLRAKLWQTSASKPTAWSVTTTDSALTLPGRVGTRSLLSVNATGTPIVYTWDDFKAAAKGAAPAGATGTLDALDGFWLRSPLHPAKDRRLLLKPTPGCPPTAGKFFIGMDQEQYVGNSATLAPVNRRLGTFMSRPRRGADSTLTLVARTFADRDEVLDTTSDGTALQFAAPPEYGIPLRYLGVGDVSVQRGMSDHRFQPRVITLPHTQVAQPAGPGTGVTGARFKDLCDEYASWDAAAANFITYDDLIRVG